MSENVGAVTLSLVLDSSKLGPQLSQVGNSVGGTLKNIVGSAFAFALGQGFFSFIQSGFKNGIGAAVDFDSQMQQNQISFETMLGSATKAQSFMEWVQQFAAKTPFEMNDVVTGSKRLLAFGFTAEQIPKMLTAIGDASSAMGMSGEEGIGRIANALGQMAAHGTVDAQDMLQLTSIGIPAWDILAQSMGKSTAEVMKLSSKGLIPAKTAISELVDGMEQRFPNMMDAQSKSYQGLMSTLNDNVVSTLGNIIKPKFEEISNTVLPHLIDVTNTVSSTFSSTHSVIQALGAGIGEAFGPTAGQVFKNLATDVKEVFGWLIEHRTGVEAALVGIAGGFAAFKVTNAVAQVKGFFNDISKGVEMFGSSGIGDVAKITGAFQKLGAGFQLFKNAATSGGGLKSISKDFTALFGLPPQAIITIAIIGALAALAVVIIKNWGPISTFFKNLWNGIQSGAQTVGNAINGAFTGASNALKTAWNGVAGFFSGIWSGIQTAATAAWNAIRTAVMAIVTPFVAAIQGPFDTLKTGLGNILNGIKDIFSGVWTVIKNVVLGLVLVFIDLITGDFDKLHSDISHILDNIKNAFSTIWNGIKTVVLGIAQTLVGYLGTIFRGGVAVLQTIGNGLKTFFTGLWNGIKNTAVSVWNGLLGFFQGLPAQFASFMSGVGDAIIHGFDSAIDFIKNLPGQMLQWGKDMIQGMIDGIKSMIGKVGDAVKGVGNKIRSALHFSRPDEGPLADYETWMPDFMQGLADGILANRYKVVSAIRSLTSDMRVDAALQPAYAGAYSGRNGLQPAMNNFKAEINLNGGEYHTRDGDKIVRQLDRWFGSKLG